MPSLDLRDKLQGSDLLIGMRWNSLQNSPRENQLAGESDTTTHTEKHKEMGWSGVCVCVCVCVCVGGWMCWDWKDSLIKDTFSEKHFYKHQMDDKGDAAFVFEK